jgi:hypothetical protein
VLLGALWLGVPLPTLAPVAQASSAQTPSTQGSPQQSLDRPSAQSSNPTQLQLPDDATDAEVQSEKGVGMVAFVIGGIVVAAVVIGALFVITRKTWTASH